MQTKSLNERIAEYKQDIIDAGLELEHDISLEIIEELQAENQKQIKFSADEWVKLSEDYIQSMTNNRFQLKIIIAFIVLTLGFSVHFWNDWQESRDCVRLQPVGAYSSGVTDSIK